MDDLNRTLNENVRICIKSRQILTDEMNIAVKGTAGKNGHLQNRRAENDKKENDQIETIIFGRHYCRGGKHYLLYEELLEGLDRPTACRMKISSDAMEMTRQGEVRAALIFEEGQSYTSNYHTAYGMIPLETKTTYYRVREKADSLEAEVKYILSADGQRVSENEIYIWVCNYPE